MGGEGAAKLWFMRRLSTAAGTTHGVFPLHTIKSPYLLLWSIFCTSWLPNFIPVKISLNVQLVFLKVGQVSKLGARASGPSFHLHGHPPLSHCSQKGMRHMERWHESRCSASLSRSAKFSQFRMYEWEINFSCCMLSRLRGCLLCTRDDQNMQCFSNIFDKGIFLSSWGSF